MRLTKIKLAGFKSFVDPTVFHVPDRIITVVGPNGCGKSNIIDAVRWVMGESAARHLRGDSMEDVIFNGSSARKPVGQASVELLFDNSQGRLGGAWARYSEIAVKRSVDRGGQSSYYLNGTLCRRRDITDIFLGTGLGPRSYGIIEQGMISRVIESKPEELRVFLEEAAGISKYKERRRETESRMRHTLDNLARVNDVREELDRQLQNLQKQARNAERYTQLRADERRLKAQLLALRWRRLEQTRQRQNSAIQEQETRYQGLQAELSALATAWLKGREQQHTLQDALRQAEARHYQLVTEIAQLEQSIEHQRQLRNQHTAELERTVQSLSSAQEQLQQDQARLQHIEQRAEQSKQALDRLQLAEWDSAQQLEASEQRWYTLQAEWEQFNQRNAKCQQQAAVEKTRIEQLERSQLQADRRLQRIQLEQQEIDLQSLEQQLAQAQDQEQQSQQRLETSQLQRQRLNERRQQLQTQLREQQQRYQETQAALQAHQGRLASLQTLQDEALQQTEQLQKLQSQGLLADAQPLLEQLDVEPGWEDAVEMVLADWLDAFCVAAIDTALISQDGIALKLIRLTETAKRPTLSAGLASCARVPVPLQDRLGGVDLAESAEQVLQKCTQLEPGQSIISPDGVWAGADWLRLRRGSKAQHGVLQREREIRRLQQYMTTCRQDITTRQTELTHLQTDYEETEQALASQQIEFDQLSQAHARLHAQSSTLQQKLASQQQRHQSLNAEAAELQVELSQSVQEVIAARQRLEEALQQSAEFERQRTALDEQRQHSQQQLKTARDQFEQGQRLRNEQALQSQALNSESKQLHQAIARVQSHCKQLQAHQQELSANAPEDDTSALRDRLNQSLRQQVSSEQDLNQARQQLAEHEQTLRQQEQSRTELEQRSNVLRDDLQAQKLAINEAQVRQQTLLDQLTEMDLELETILAELPEHDSEHVAKTDDEAEWVLKIESIAARIQRLGAINLAAIEEHAQTAERKSFLDAQDADLHEALAILEEAMSKIDRETRSRFKAIFEQVNAQLGVLYPRLFGGGEAYLELSGADTLNAGVAIIARPPGKRLGTLQLLSGGEKALTAIALIFSIFQLNPAPFCMLDEVDAPLDDANVGRFGKLVGELSQQVQFIIVTHNKMTMEIAQHLAGVTMHEPGVSRLVAVDVDEAVRLAAV